MNKENPFAWNETIQELNAQPPTKKPSRSPRYALEFCKQEEYVWHTLIELDDLENCNPQQENLSKPDLSQFCLTWKNKMKLVFNQYTIL